MGRQLSLAEAGTPLPDALAAAGVVLDYGDADAEYAAVRQVAGVVDRRDLASLIVYGRDPIRMVQGLITNDLAAAAEDRAVYGAMLTPKGRTIAELRALKVTEPQGTEVWIYLPREVLDAATAHLRRSVPPLYARWRDATEELAVLGVYGPRSHELLEAVLEAPVPALEEDALATIDYDGGTLRLLGTRYAGGEAGIDILGNPALTGPLAEELIAWPGGGVRRVGFTALEALRIEAGRPRGGRELTEDTIPTEAFESTGEMQRAISFGKGCYTGQEVIVRIAHRGHVNRHLRGLVLPAAHQVIPGARLYHPETGKDVGWVTSVTGSPMLGEVVALGFIRREVEPGGTVRTGDAEGPEARVIGLPFRAEDRPTRTSVLASGDHSAEP